MIVIYGDGAANEVLQTNIYPKQAIALNRFFVITDYQRVRYANPRSVILVSVSIFKPAYGL